MAFITTTWGKMSGGNCNMNQNKQQQVNGGMQTEQVQYWNIVKGMGIILVVAGHACGSSEGTPVSNYIYLFHLPLFFFVSGYLYNEEKYGDNPYANIAARLKSSWIKYVFIYWGLILFHNIFLRLQMLEENAVFYSRTDMLRAMSNAVLGMGREMMGGTLWFVPTVVMASSLLGMIVWLSRTFRLFRCGKWKYLFQGVMILGCAVAGYVLELRAIDLAAHIQIVLIVMPFLWIGYLVRKGPVDLKRALRPVVAVISAIILLFVNPIYTLDLVFFIVYPFMYIIAFLGIYMCLTAASLVQRLKGFRDIIALYGRASFWIMFLHFPVIKVFDWIYTMLYNDGNMEQYRVLPVAYTYLWPVYLLLGLLIPIILYLAGSSILKNLRKIRGI